MNDIEIRIKKAQSDPSELEMLLNDYLPLLKKQAGEAVFPSLEYEDRLSLAMLTFAGCVKQYSEGKGSFLAFFTVCYRNRLTDESRKESRYHNSRVLSLSPAPEADRTEGVAVTSCDTDKISLEAYDREQERLSLCEEIDRLSEALKAFHITWKELPRICPRQARAKDLCLQLASAVIVNEEYRAMFFGQKKLPRAQLAAAFSISPKTVEKHRRYISALVILLSGDYPGIKAFLPQYREVK